MITLGEVINKVESAWVCPSSDESSECCELMEVRDDILQYLKWYKELDDDSEAYAEWKENPPLTWDELKQMEGKPVWVEWLSEDIWSDPNHRESGTWWVVGEVRKNDIIIAQYLDEAELCEEDLGNVWQAYKREWK